MKNEIYIIKERLKKTFYRSLNSLLKKNKMYNRYIFSNIYKFDKFNSFSSDKESKSGPGSNLEQTAQIAAKLPELFTKYNIKSILDIPCGDFNWMKDINIDSIVYTGGDIVPSIITNNNTKFSTTNIIFKEIDIISDSLPKVDLVFCRDIFVHLKNDQILMAINNIKRSGSKYLLVTSFKDIQKNNDIDKIGTWRPLNLAKAPFYLNLAIDEIHENCTEANGKFNDKYLVLYTIEKL